MNMFLMLERLISQPVIERLGWVLVHSLWQFALLAILVGVSVRLLRRSSASMRYGVLVVAMALSVAAPVATWLVQPVTLPSDLAARPIAAVPEVEPEAEARHPTDVAAHPEGSLLAAEGKPFKPNEEVAITPPLSPPAPVLREVAPPPPWLERVQSVMRPWLVWIVAGWGLGVALCSLRPLLGWHMIRRLRREGISPASDEVLAAMHRVSKRLGLRRAVEIWNSTLTQVPIVVGYLRPVVLLPVSLATSLPISQLEAILAHELAHVRRHDFLVNLLQTLVETLFFYHPAIWWLSRQIRVEREHCCDDLVVALLGDRIEYGRALVAIEQIRGQSSLLALGAADGSLLARVRRILGRAADPLAVRRRDRLPMALLGVAVCGLAIGVSMVWMVTAQDAAATEGDTAKFSATLPNGATVELAGVGFHKWKRHDWWQPNGKPLPKAPRDEALREVRLSECDAGKQQGDCREFAIRITGLPKRKELFGYQFTYGALTDAPARAVMYEPTDFRTAQFPAKPDVKTVTLRIGMDEFPEEVSRSIGMEGKKLGAAPALVALRKADDDVQMVSAETINGQTQLLLKEIPRGKGPLVDEGVPIAIDKDGKRHESIRAGGRPGFFAYLYPVPLDQIARFEYRLRLYRHWVTFENVSLHAGEKTEVKVRVESISQKRQLTAAERAARVREIDMLREEGRAALARGDYQAMATAYGTLSKMADGPYGHLDAVSLGHSLHIVGKWQEARDAYRRAITLADERLAELDQMTGPEEEEVDDEGRPVDRPVRDWQRERDRERERIADDWPQIVLLAGQVELMLGEVEPAVKTLSRGIRFAPLVESLEKLTEAAQAAVDKPPERPPTPHWHKLMYPIATQYHLALAYDKLGNTEAAARCWSRVHLSYLAYQVGMAEVDADHLVKVISQIPAAKRQPFHELVLKNPGTRRAPKPPAFDYQEPLKQDPRNPFQVLAKLDGFQLTKLGPPRATLAKLKNGTWVMAFTGGDVRQARIYLSSSADGKAWSAPWEFTHNNIFPTRNPSLIVDDDGLLWMLCSSQRFSTSPYSSGAYRPWLCSSRDGREWSPLRPVKTSFEVSGQYQQTVQVTRDRTGKFWVISPQEMGSADSLDKLTELRPIKFPGEDKKRFVEDMHASFDERNRCHLVFSESGILYSSSSNMVDWTAPVKFDGKDGTSIDHPQTLTQGNRILALYESGGGGWLRSGKIEADSVTWTERIPICLPLGGSLAARDGERLLLPSGRIGNGVAPVVLVAEILKLAAFTEKPADPPAGGESSLKATVTMEPEVMVGEPAWIKFKLQNPSDKKLIVVFNGDYRNRTTNPLNPKVPESFAVEMRGPDGKAIPPLEPNSTPNSVVRPWLELPAKGEGVIELFLPHWAKLTEPGKYGVNVRCQCERYLNDGPEWSRQKPEMLDLVAETTLSIVPASDEKLGALVDRLGPKLLVRNSMEAVAEADRAHRMLLLIRHERAVAWYVKLLAQPGYTQMFQACDGLAPYGSDAAFAALRRAMKLTGKDLVSESPKQAEVLANNLRHAAAGALAANPHPEAAAFLLAQSADPYDGVRLTVLHFAARIKTKKALEVIDQLTKDPDKSVREEALREQKEVRAEDKAGAKADIPGPGDRGAVDPPRKKTIDEIAQEKLAAAGLKPAEGVVEKQVLDILRTPFVDDPKKGSWQFGAHEMTVLLKLADLRPQDRVVNTLLKVVDRSEKANLDERRLAMLYLSGYASQQVLPLLIKELEQAVETPQKKFVPYHEIAMLARMGELGENASAAMPILIRLLDYPDALVRREAIGALVKVGPSSTEALDVLAKNFDDPIAVYQAGRYGEMAKPLGPKFVKLLDSKNKETRIWAAQALVKSKFDEARGFDELLADVAQGTPENRMLAATALAALGSQAKSMIKKLGAYQNDADERVANQVRDAIGRIQMDDRIFTHAEEAAKNAAARQAAAEVPAKAGAAEIPPPAEVADEKAVVEKVADAPANIRLAGDEVSAEAITKLAGRELGILTLADAKFSGQIVERLRHVKSIRTLRLFGTGLSGQIPRLEHVTGLIGLEIGAPLTGRDLEAIGQLADLEQLGMPQEMTMNVSGAREIARLTKLKSLGLYNVNIDDASFAELRTLVHLEELDLTHTRITDAGLATIEKFPLLKTLELYRFPDWHTKEQLTDASLPSIARLTNLERLSLSGKVSDAGLKHVARLPKLKSLMILGTEVTGNGLGALEHSKVETLVLGADQLGPAPAGLEERDPTLEQFPALVNLKKCRALKHIMVNGKFLGEESKWWQRLLPDIGWGFSS